MKDEKEKDEKGKEEKRKDRKMKDERSTGEEMPGTGELLALYGAGMVAVSVCCAVKELYKDCHILCFIVSDKGGNPAEIYGLPVISIDEFCVMDKKQDIRILVAAPENHHGAITRELEKRGLTKYMCVDSRTEADLMERYYDSTSQGSQPWFPSLRSYSMGVKMPFVRVYMARFHRDAPLKDPCDLPGWICPIQAGAALTEIRVAELQDHTGDNISEKNKNYSELSALYWIWKNGGDRREGPHRKGTPDGRTERGKDGYMGLFHYRRVLDIWEEDFSRLEAHKIDAVLPYPTIHYPSICEHHRRYVKDSDWEAMTAALWELAPEDAKSLPEILSQPYFYNYNMFIARENIFQDFCGWLFPILERTEELSSPKGWQRADRYIGYLGENLTTLYFMYHRDDLKIAHTGRIMLT